VATYLRLKQDEYSAVHNYSLRTAGFQQNLHLGEEIRIYIRDKIKTAGTVWQ